MFLLLIGCSTEEKTDDNKTVENIEESTNSEEDENEVNNDGSESSEDSESTDENEENQTESNEVNKSDLTLVNNHPLNELGSFKIVYKDNNGHLYIEDQNTGLIYEFEDYFENESLWSSYITDYDQALQNYYNDDSESNSSQIFDFVDSDALNTIMNNKASGNFTDHTSSIEFKESYRNSETSVIVVATRKYNHSSGEGIVTNKYYINLINGNKITYWEEIE